MRWRVDEPAVPDTERRDYRMVLLDCDWTGRADHPHDPMRTKPRSWKSRSDAVLPSVITAPTSRTPASPNERSEIAIAA